MDLLEQSGVISRIFEKRASKGQQTNLKDPTLNDMFGYGRESAAGIQVTPEAAEGLSAIFACVNLLSSVLAMIPLYLYEEQGDSKKKAKDHPLFNILAKLPNKMHTAIDFWQIMLRNMLLFGNGYALIVRDNSGKITELLPLNPKSMMVFIGGDGLPAYKYTYVDGTEAIYLNAEILHLVDYYDYNGFIGRSRVQVCQDTTGLYMAAEEFSSKFFANGSMIAGVLQHPSTLSDTAYARLLKSWNERHSGAANAYKPALLEEGVTWQSIGVKPEDAQLLDTRKQQVIEACRLYNVPPHMIQSLDKATYSNIEDQSINFATYSLMIPATKVEQNVYKDLLLTSEKQRYTAEYDMKTLTRGNTVARMTKNKEMFYMGAYSQNDVRREEGENPIEGGDVYYVPANLLKADEAMTNDNTEGNENV